MKRLRFYPSFPSLSISILSNNSTKNISIASSLLSEKYGCQSSSSTITSSPSSTTNNNSTSTSATSSKPTPKSIGKKFTPPPPTFGFAAKTRKENSASSNNNNIGQQQKAQAVPSSKAFATGRTGIDETFYGYSSSSNSNANLNAAVGRFFFSTKYRYISVSAKDVLEDMINKEFEAEQAKTSVVNKLELKKVEVVKPKKVEVKIVSEVKKSVLEPTTDSNSENNSGGHFEAYSPPISYSSSSSSSAAATSATIRALSSALRGPEEIIFALRIFTRGSGGKVPFDQIPPAVVRALVGHDGFGNEPKLNEEEHPGIVSAVTRIVAPVGVFSVDQKRNVIKLKPGVTQLAARIDSCADEIVGNSIKKVTYSAVYANLTGTERAFTNDVGGLSRITLLFPEKFVVSKDLLSFQRIQQPGAAAGKVRAEPKNSSSSSSSSTTNVSSSESTENKTPTTTSTTATTATAATAFEQGVKELKTSDKQRLSRLTTGASLLNEESIFTDDLE